MKKQRMYILLLVASLIGFGWLFYNYKAGNYSDMHSINACLFKHITSIPCPSCGTTRSAISIIQLKFLDAINYNPLGIVVFLIMSIAPVWVIFDIIFKRDSLFVCYQKAESFFRQKVVAIPAISLILMNWIWNIIKQI